MRDEIKALDRDEVLVLSSQLYALAGGVALNADRRRACHKAAAALTAQADEIERLRTLAKANNDLAKLQAGQLDQYRRAVTFDPSIVDGLETKLIEWANKIAGPKGGKSYHPDPIGVAEMCDDVMRAALKAAQEVKA